MTDGQWLWLFVNQLIDNEEHLEKMCPDCRNEVTSTSKCIRCGKVLSNNENTFINPNFDASRFERLSQGGIEYEEDVDVGLMKQLKDGVDIG
jgi:succinate dehydrogenase/fumarate reductase-like Fe-S protein